MPELVITSCATFTVTCEWTYEDFGACTKTCGGGSRSRYPRIITPAQHGGDCPQYVTNREPDTQQCNTQSCLSENILSSSVFKDNLNAKFMPEL